MRSARRFAASRASLEARHGGDRDREVARWRAATTSGPISCSSARRPTRSSPSRWRRRTPRSSTRSAPANRPRAWSRTNERAHDQAGAPPDRRRPPHRVRHHDAARRAGAGARVVCARLERPRAAVQAGRGPRRQGGPRHRREVLRQRRRLARDQGLRVRRGSSSPKRPSPTRAPPSR